MTNSPDDFDPTLDAVRNRMKTVRLSDAARTRIAERLARESADGTRLSGSTTLRAVGSPWRRHLGWIAAAAAGALLLAWGLRAVDRSTTVSAAEILGRSQQALSAATSGIEKITYDLTLDGVLLQLLPEGQAGRFTVEETIDHDHPGRLRVVKLAADGRLAAGLADDPLARTRVRYVRFDSRGFLLRFTDAPAPPLSLASARRLALQILLGLMQTSANPSLAEIDRSGEAAYEITIPTMAMSGPIVLQRARAIISREDARLLDFDAAGSIGRQPFAVTFNMRSRELRQTTQEDANEFTIAPSPGDEVLEARGSSSIPVWDVISRCLNR
ncbi:MAG: hypothetical protein DMF84_04495 [Acidobacteria bacterium]|nr:MAG: hypothetical protein DMF84_04495 [Acidobacteriota bacterium]